jgi:hypothetical protein
MIEPNKVQVGNGAAIIGKAIDSVTHQIQHKVIKPAQNKVAKQKREFIKTQGKNQNLNKNQFGAGNPTESTPFGGEPEAGSSATVGGPKTPRNPAGYKRNEEYAATAKVGPKAATNAARKSADPSHPFYSQSANRSNYSPAEGMTGLQNSSKLNLR